MEAAAKEYEQVIGAGIEKVVRRLIKRYSGMISLYFSYNRTFEGLRVVGGCL
jgi:hypothetical protein